MTFKFNWYVLTDGPKVMCSGCSTESKVVSLTVNTEITAKQRYQKLMAAKLNTPGNKFTYEDVEVNFVIVSL